MLCASACLGTVPEVKHHDHHQKSHLKEAGVAALLVTALALCFQLFQVHYFLWQLCFSLFQTCIAR